MAFLKKVFAWKKRGAIPPASMQQNGLTAGTKLPADYLNEQWTATAEAIEELQEKVIEKTTAATSTSLGLVRNGSNIDNNSGVLSVKNSTTSARGVVQLNDTITSSLTTVAATARAVKEVADGVVAVNSTLADFANGGKLTPIEKLSLLRTWHQVEEEKTILTVQADLHLVDTTFYIYAYNSYNDYLFGSSGVLVNMNSTSTITTSILQQTITDYNSEKLRLLTYLSNSVRITTADLSTKITNTETALNNKIASNQSTILNTELPKYYKNGSGGGTLSNATSLSAGGIVSNAGSFFVGVDTLLIVANKNGFNNGNGTTLMPMRADYYEGNRLISEATRHLYFGTDGNVRVTSRGTSTNETITYRSIQASSFDVASSYTYKQDISEMTRSALDIVDVLKIHEYRLIGDVENGVLDNWQIGLIAEYSPQVATDENMKIDTYKMQSLNWKATQELYQIAKGHEMAIGLQQTQIDDLRQEIADIKALLQ